MEITSLMILTRIDKRKDRYDARLCLSSMFVLCEYNSYIESIARSTEANSI